MIYEITLYFLGISNSLLQSCTTRLRRARAEGEKRGEEMKRSGDGSSDDDEVDELDDLTSIEREGPPALPGLGSGHHERSTALTCQTTPCMHPAVKTVDEAQAIAVQAKAAHDAAREEVERATAAFAAAKKAEKKQRARTTVSSQGEPKAALAAKAASAKSAEDKAAATRTAWLTATHQLDMAKLRALSLQGELVNKDKNPGARIIQQVLDHSELEREYCARHPQWRANLQTEGLAYKRVEDVYVLHSGHGGIGRRRASSCCAVVGTKHNVRHSKYCQLVIRQSNLEMHFEFEEKTRIRLCAASTLNLKGLPYMPARVELINQNGQYMWLWDVSPQVLPVIIKAYQGMRMEAARQSKPHAAPTLPPMIVASDCRYCPITLWCIGTITIRQLPLFRIADSDMSC